MDVPLPVIGPSDVLVQTAVTAISPGTEAAVTKLAQSSLLSKARARPDLVRQVIRKARLEGLGQTVQSVRSRLDEDLPLGYSGAGVVVEVGGSVSGIRIGDRVATGGAGKANHAEFQAVPGLLCAPIPDNVSLEDASFSTIASIALHGLRQAEVQAGSRIVVIGLGLVGQFAVRLAKAAGCSVFGIDVADYPARVAEEAGAISRIDQGDLTTTEVIEWSRGRGADAVLVTAAVKSSEPMMRATDLCRDRAVVVVVGDIGLELDRRPFYEKELEIRFARSYGPGRYERSYEEWGVDYPEGYVRWTEGRNLEAVIDLLDSGSLTLRELITHRFPIDEAPQAYRLIETRPEPYLGIILTYGKTRAQPGSIRTAPIRRTNSPGVGLIGAGSFARSVLLPSMKDAGFERFVAVTSASGLSARKISQSFPFEEVASSTEDILDHPDVDLVVIATPHSSHAEFTLKALAANKHVFCEKPLALSMGEVDEIESALGNSKGTLFVGLNRRWSEPVQLLEAYLKRGTGPLAITYRVNAGRIPPTHWYRDRRQGGRLIGEACHFIDTCRVLASSPVSDVSVLSGRGTETLLVDDFVIALAFADGSLAAITYASSGSPATPKERIEVLGRGMTGELLDFRSVTCGNRTKRFRPQDKGHVQQFSTVLNAIKAAGESLDDTRDLAHSFIETTRVTLRAAALLGISNETLHSPENRP